MVNDADPFAFDPLRSVYPSEQVFSPGTGYLFVYSMEPNQVSVELDDGNGVYSELDGSPFDVPRDGVVTIPAGAGHHRLTGTQDFVVFNAAENTCCDQMTSSVSMVGYQRGTELVVWSKQYVVAIAGSEAPGPVTLYAYADGSWTEVGQATLSDPLSATRFGVSVEGLFKVVADQAPVAAYGSLQNNPANHFTYLAAEDGTEVGTRVQYQPPPFSGAGELVIQAVEAGTDVIISGGADLSGHIAEPGEVFRVSGLASDTLYRVEAAAPVLAWVETTPGSGSCDGTIMDMDMVPGLETGTDYDRWFLFSTTVSPTECYTDRRPDIDLLVFEDDTTARVQVWSGTRFETVNTVELSAGQRYRVGTDVTPGTLYRIASDQPIHVVHSHVTSEFVGNGYSHHRLHTPTRQAGEPCDPLDTWDHCALGLVCQEDGSGSATCVAACGNGVLEFWEDCDDGEAQGEGTCPEGCLLD